MRGRNGGLISARCTSGAVVHASFVFIFYVA
jgi:hypothetical protein